MRLHAARSARMMTVSDDCERWRRAAPTDFWSVKEGIECLEVALVYLQVAVVRVGGDDHQEGSAPDQESVAPRLPGGRWVFVLIRFFHFAFLGALWFNFREVGLYFGQRVKPQRALRNVFEELAEELIGALVLQRWLQVEALLEQRLHGGS
eukprot:6456936-Amphidinium_carterae.1